MSKSVEALSSLLGIESEVLEASLKDDTLDSRIADFTAKRKILPVDDFDKLKSNLQKEAIEAYEKDLPEKAKRGELPTEVHKILKGSTLEMLEKKLAKENGIASYDSFDDLVAKIKQTSGGKIDDSELSKKIEELKEVNKHLEKKAQEAETNSEKKIKETLIGIKREQIISSLPFDAGEATGADADKVKANQAEILNSLFDRNYNLEMKDGKLYVTEKDGNVLKDTATLDPLSVDVVYINLAKKYGIQMKSPENGGQGGSSSKSNNTGIWTKEAYEREAAKVNDSNALADLRRKYKKENPSIQI